MPRCFAVKRGEITVRLDPFYSLPEHRSLQVLLSEPRVGALPIGDDGVVKEVVEGRITPTEDAYSDEPHDPVFLRAQNIEEGYLNFGDSKRLSPQAFASEPKAILQTGDVVLTIDGVLLGIAAVCHEGDEPSCISNHMVRLIPGGKIIPDYLSWFLNSHLGQRQIKQGITGSAIPGIRTDAIQRIRIPVPSRDFQRALVAEVEEARKAWKHKLEQADALLSGFDAFLFEQLGSSARHMVTEGRNLGFAVRRDQLGERMDPKYLLFSVSKAPRKIQSKRLQTLVAAEPDYGSGERALPRTGEGDIKYIRITDFDDFGLAPNDQLMTAANVDDNYFLQDEDVLFARSGATAGKTFIYSKDIGPAIFAGYCIRFRFDRTKALPWYVYFYTKTAHYKAWVKSIQRPSGQPNINREEFKSFEIPLPSLDKQSEIVAELLRHRHEARRLRAEAAKEWEEAKANFERQLLGKDS